MQGKLTDTVVGQVVAILHLLDNHIRCDGDDDYDDIGNIPGLDVKSYLWSCESGSSRRPASWLLLDCPVKDKELDSVLDPLALTSKR